tara:strand:- start:34326 stop:35210 length:885 start_codon:yes stop_codon:yes gene_type:complete
MPVKEYITILAEATVSLSKDAEADAASAIDRKHLRSTTRAKMAGGIFPLASRTFRWAVKMCYHTYSLSCSTGSLRIFRIPGEAMAFAGRGMLMFLIMNLAAASLSGETPAVPPHSLPGSTWTVLEDFESVQNWKLARPRFSDQSARLGRDGPMSGPYAGSKGFASLLFRGNSATPAILEPPAPIKLGDYSQRLSLYVYGWNQPVRMTLLLRDRNGKLARSAPQSLQFEGWKRLEIELPDELQRRPEGPFQEFYIELMGLELRPVYDETIPVRASVDDLRLLSAPALKLPAPFSQ